MDREFVLPTDSEKLPHRAIFDAIRRRREEAEAALADEPPAETEASPEVTVAEQTAVVAQMSFTLTEIVYPEEPSMEAKTEAVEATSDALDEVELEPIAKVASEGENASLPNPTFPTKALRFPDGKKYYRIAEVAELLEAEPEQLRRWEQHFGAIVKPEKHGGQRVYRRKDLRALHLIRHMIVEEHYSVADARRFYRARRRALDEQAGVERKRAIESLETTAQELRELLKLALHN